MAAIIHFGGSAAGAGKPGGDRVKVTDDADAVAERLAGAQSGFAEFSLEERDDVKVWVNRSQVQMIRSVS